ncbi:MAG: hypothetical protein H0X62_09875 [Bacteroidetes bacterium]|nr:hypothetical protein [Bacteroidota bacterium]
MKKSVLILASFLIAGITGCEPETNTSNIPEETTETEQTEDIGALQYFASVNGQQGDILLTAKEFKGLKNIGITDGFGNPITDIESITFDLTTIVKSADGASHEISLTSTSSEISDHQREKLFSEIKEGHKFFIENVKLLRFGDENVQPAMPVNIIIKE